MIDGTSATAAGVTFFLSLLDEGADVLLTFEVLGDDSQEQRVFLRGDCGVTQGVTKAHNPLHSLQRVKL